MKKRLLSLTLIAALCLSLFPTGTAPALAASEGAPDTLLVGGTNVKSGGYWTTGEGGTLSECEDSTELPEEWNVHYDTSNNTLTLKNATIMGETDATGNSNGAAIYAAGDAGQDVTLTIEVEGSNVISGVHGIYMLGESSSKENPSLSLSIEKAANLTKASLKITGTDNGITLDNVGSKSLSISNVDVTASGGKNGAGVYMSGSGGYRCSLSANGCTLTVSGSTGIACVAENNEMLPTTVTLQNHAVVDARGGGFKCMIDFYKSDSDSGGLLYDENDIWVVDAFTLEKDMTIDAGMTLYVGQDGYSGYLTILKDGTLTNNGTVTILGDSTLTNDGSFTNNGTVTVSDGSALTNNGTLYNYGTLIGEIDGNGTVIPTYTFNYPSKLTLTANGGFYTASDTLSLSEESVLGQAKVVVYGTNKTDFNPLTLSKEGGTTPQTIPFKIGCVTTPSGKSAYLEGTDQTKVFAILESGKEDTYTLGAYCEDSAMKQVLSGTYTGTFKLYVGYTTDDEVKVGDEVEDVELDQLTPCTVTVTLENNLGLGITTQPSDVTVDEGNAATFNVVASGNIQSYQWQVNSGNGWSDITGATSDNYTIDRTTTAMSGNQYRCIVTGDSGAEVTSNAATLTVRSYEPPYNGKYSYEIVSDVGENGTIDVDRYATEGDQVTITVSPDEAYLLDALTVTSGGKDVALTDNGDGTYTFTMPSGDVAITATFAEDPNWEEPEDPATDVSEIFTDVPANHWAQAAIQYVYDNGLMTGVSDTAFAPEATTTRAMIVSMLARMENATSAADAGFADVAAGDWYATAVNWAAANGIVNGISDDTFAPNDPITREQLAAMLMNYAQWKGQDISARADLSDYTDAPSTWASEAVQWAVAEGLLAGVTDDQLQPRGQATRAQVAAILERFLEA